MYFRKKPVLNLPQEETAVWSCTKEECSGWVRDDFAFQQVPSCWQCGSPMTRSMKMLPKLVNKNKDMKAKKQGVAIR